MYRTVTNVYGGLLSGLALMVGSVDQIADVTGFDLNAHLRPPAAVSEATLRTQYKSVAESNLIIEAIEKHRQPDGGIDFASARISPEDIEARIDAMVEDERQKQFAADEQYKQRQYRELRAQQAGLGGAAFLAIFNGICMYRQRREKESKLEGPAQG